MDNYTPTKRCTICQVELPATTDYFNRLAKGLNNLNSQCRNCLAKQKRDKRREKGIPARNLSVERYGLKQCSHCKEWKAATLDCFRFDSRRGKLVGCCIECLKSKSNTDKNRENARRWYYENPERAKETRQNYQRSHEELHRAINQKYRDNHREELKSKRRIQYKENPGQWKASHRRRKDRECGLTNAFLAKDWQRALEYFNGCCAVCGRPPGLWHTLATDHWIPLDSPDCPGTVPTNIVPLCHGQGGCNNSKHNKDPLEWLIQKFGSRKAKRIMKTIEQYFEWLCS